MTMQMLFEQCLGKLVSDGIVEMALDFITGLLDPASGDKLQTQDEILKVLVRHELGAGPDMSMQLTVQYSQTYKPDAAAPVLESYHISYLMLLALKLYNHLLCS